MVNEACSKRPEHQEKTSAHLHRRHILLARPDIHRGQSLLELHGVRQGLGRLGNADGVERGGAARAKGVHADALADLGMSAFHI